MAFRAARLCPRPTCRNLVPCSTHARQPWAQATSRQARGYGAEWERLRLSVLREEGACRYCGLALLDGAGDPIPGATVDHRLAKCEGGTDDRSNLCACCAECQQRKASREGSRGRARMSA